MSVDIFSSGLFSSSFWAWWIADEGPSSTAARVLFNYYGGIYIVDFGVNAYLYGGYWTPGAYKNLTIKHDPCNDRVDYFYGGQLILSHDLTGDGSPNAPWISRAILLTDNAGEIWDVDNYSVIRGEPCPTCEPVENPDVRTQGFWKRQCQGPHPSGEHDNLPTYVDCVNNTATFVDVGNVDDLCDRLTPNPRKDKCEQAEAQFMALTLNLCSGRVETCNCIDDPDFDTVGEAAEFIDGLLSNPARTRGDCVQAQAIADGLNNGLTLVACP